MWILVRLGIRRRDESEDEGGGMSDGSSSEVVSPSWLGCEGIRSSRSVRSSCELANGISPIERELLDSIEAMLCCDSSSSC